MEYRELGQTGRTVSRIGFGGAPAGLKNYLQLYDPADRRQRDDFQAAIRTALALGINYFDTAPGYGGGISEQIFGEALADQPEDQLWLATKVSPCGRDEVLRSLERSLTNLRRSSVDCLQIHGDTISDQMAADLLAPDGMIAGMEQARREGMVRHIGFTSENMNGAVETLIASGRLETLQIGYNFLFQHPYEPTRPFGCMLQAEAAGMGIITMRTTTSGLFQRWIRQIRPDDDFDYTPALIQFVLSNPLVDTALIGMRSPAEVRQNCAICDDLGGRIDLDDFHQRYRSEN